MSDCFHADADEGSFVNLQHKHNFAMAHFGMMLGMMCRTLQGDALHTSGALPTSPSTASWVLYIHLSFTLSMLGRSAPSIVNTEVCVQMEQ